MFKLITFDQCILEKNSLKKKLCILYECAREDWGIHSRKLSSPRLITPPFETFMERNKIGFG